MVNIHPDKFKENPAFHIEEFIKSIVRDTTLNKLHLIDDSPYFEEPLVGIASGDDPLFSEYKNIIGPFHLTPREILEQSVSLIPEVAQEKLKEVSVICWVLPIPKRTRAANAQMNIRPTIRWSHTRYYGERFNEDLRRKLVTFLTGLGYRAVAPHISDLWRMYPKYPGGYTSNWSERHALYAAGLGTFGLSRGFITPKGKAMRCGSVVVNLPLVPSKRIYKSHTDNCPYYTDKSCGVCIDRCPSGAITANGQSKSQCFSYMGTYADLKPRYGVDILGCGLCQTKVPCESKIPPKAN